MNRVIVTKTASCSVSKDQRGVTEGHVFWTCRLLGKGGKLIERSVDVELAQGVTPTDSDIQKAISQTKAAV